MQLTPNCKKFLAEVKKVDEDYFDDYLTEDLKDASCKELDDSGRYSSWKDYLDDMEQSLVDSFNYYDFLAGMVEKKPHLKALYEAPSGYEDSGDEYAVADFLSDKDFWFEGFTEDYFRRLRNSRDLKRRFDDLKSDLLYDCRDDEEERRDPYGYRGLSKSMFYASRKVTASDRSALIRLASTMPAGSPERKAILSGLTHRR
jgi:hypothetical protein